MAGQRRARGANAQLLLAINEGVYGAIPADALGAYVKLPFVSSGLGEEQTLLASDLIGTGRAPGAPSDNPPEDSGDMVVPVDLRNFGFWLKLLLGDPTTTTGLAALGSYTFSAQPANNATITVGGQAFTFTTGTPAANQIKIGATLADTVANAVIALNASAVAGVAAASYAANLAGDKIEITHDTVGTAGNSFTIVAGSSPASNATASGATLAGGATTGAKNHVFTSGKVDLPDAAVEIGLTDADSYGLNYGVVADTLAIAFQRSGHLNATLGLVGQGEVEPRPTTSVVADPADLLELETERFSQFSGQIGRDGVPFADMVSGNFRFANGIDRVEVIRGDGRIAGADAGQETASLGLVARFRDNTLFDLAFNKTPVEVSLSWRISAVKRLVLTYHYVRLPKPKLPVAGPGGVQSEFTAEAFKHPTLGRVLTVLLVNDVDGY